MIAVKGAKPSKKQVEVPEKRPETTERGGIKVRALRKRALILLGVLCLIGIICAQVSPNYNLNWHVIGGGGGSASSSNYRMSGTVGQLIGLSSSSNYQVGGGYWYGVSETPVQPPISFDTGPGTYPSIPGTHHGTITPALTVSVGKLYTYPCPKTGGHTEYAKIWNASWNGAEAYWNGYQGDWYNISFNNSFTLYANQTYNYTIRTGSYPQIIHASSHNATGGVIACTEFVEINGKRHEGWILAIRLE